MLKFWNRKSSFIDRQMPYGYPSWMFDSRLYNFRERLAR